MNPTLSALAFAALTLTAGFASPAFSQESEPPSASEKPPGPSIESVEALMDDEDLEPALAMIGELMSGKDESAELLILRGIVQLELGNTTESILDFEKAARLDPKNTATAVNLAAARIASGDLDTAIKSLSDLIKENAEDADAYRNRALAFSKQKKYQNAIADYTIAMALYGGIDPALFEERAACWKGLGNVAQAEIDARIAAATYKLDEDEENTSAYVKRALDLYNLGEHYLALLDLDNAIELGADSHAVYLARGNCLFVLEEPEAALEELDQAIRLNANSAPAYASRANLFESLDEFDAALKDYETGLRIDARDELVRTELAWLLATCPKASLRDGKRALKLARSVGEEFDWKRWRDLAICAAAFAAAGDFSKAVEYQEKAIKLAPVEEENAQQVALKRFQSKQILTWAPETNSARTSAAN